MTNFPRFDLQESSYAILLMADRTPAWREVYTEVLDGLAARYTQHWAAVDWLTQFGDDPDRAKYPSQWKGSLIPARLWGDYNTPGWTANGTNPYPTAAERAAAPFCEAQEKFIQPDPIAAEAMLFFKGWLLLVMGAATRVGGQDQADGKARWERPWKMAGVGGQEFEYTLTKVAEHLVRQWQEAAPRGGLH